MAIQRIVVLGDSVHWGQGLQEQHKFARLVANGLGGLAPASVEMYAHSGAVIDPSGKFGNDVDRCDAFSHEIPLPAPTIRSQVRNVSHPETVDLALVNGGINDVSIYRILNPLTRSQDLAREIQGFCYAGMKLLLTEALSAFTKPGSTIVVTGYYPYLSAQSDRSLIEDLLNVFGISLPDHLDADPLLDQIAALSVQFWTESNAALAQAIREVAPQAKSGQRAVYVPGPFNEENALFAPEPWLFGLQNGINPEDEVAADRKAACDCCYTNPLELMQHETCRLASVGHPNLVGAQKYATAILAAYGK